MRGLVRAGIRCSHTQIMEDVNDGQARHLDAHSVAAYACIHMFQQ